MQKKYIALAIASLVSTATFAQTNVTIYGAVDAGYAYRWDKMKSAPGLANSRSSIDTGQSIGNRLGFRGMEDLGNGFKAIFLLEQGFSFDSGTQGQAGKMFGRQAYVGLSGDYGTAIAGRLYTPHFAMVATIDPFGAGSVGEYRNVWGNTGGFNGSGLAAVKNLLDPTRVDNAIAYSSPNWQGFDLTVAYSNALAIDDNATLGSNTTETSGNNAKNNTLYALVGKYAAGPIMISFNTHRIAAGSDVPDSVLKTLDNYALGGTYDLNVVKFAAVASYSIWDTSVSQGDGRMSNYLLGATVPLGKFALKGSVNHSDFNGGSRAAAWQHGSATQYAIGADYNLSKRTSLYSAYSLIDAQQSRSGSVTMTDSASNNGNAAPGNPWLQGFQMGIRHQF